MVSTILPVDFWSTIMWGLSNNAKFLLSHKELHEYAMMLKQKIQNFNFEEFVALYYFPYLSFIKNYMPLCLNSLGPNTKKEFHRDMIFIIKQCINKC